MAEETEKPAAKRRVELVGIGASAGGIGAMQALLEALPDAPGMAFALVMHLDPVHKSALAEVLSKHTRMKVEQVTGAIEIAPDHVYVVPPDRQLVVADGRLDLREFDEPRGRRAPIDLFFRSLAESELCTLAVLLSGGGTDGIIGLRAIKGHNGIVLVQDPRETESESMPRSALEAGLVDFCLPVRELAAKLVELHRAGDGLPVAAEELEDDESKALERVLGELRERVGHDFTRYKPSTVLRRIARRMQIHGLDRLADYRRLLRERPGESDALFADLLIGVTSFFRDPEAWAELEQLVVPRLLEGKGAGDAVRVWVPGCATGEEAYSLGMLLLDHLARSGRGAPVLQVFATDLDPQALEVARAGEYPAAITADVPEERLARYFSIRRDHYQVNKKLRDVMLFALHGLVRDPPFAHLDLISCRNLLIYMQRDLQEQVFDIFRYALARGGFLFLGASEGPNGEDDRFRQVSPRHRIYQLNPAPREPAHVPRAIRGAVHGRASRPLEGLVRPPAPAAAGSAHRRLLEELAPPSLLVDDRHRILHLSETVGRFLLPPAGEPTQEVTRLVRPELRAPIESALQRAFGAGGAATMSPVPVRINGDTAVVQVVARRRAGDPAADGLALIVFLEHEPAVADDGSTAAESSALQELEGELLRTRQELREVREHHAASDEELRAANEELQSINEEYRSTTEELETSKEELQSINKELQTVNAELRASYDQLHKTHGDLINLTAATDIATLFLDRELEIRRFTPQLAKLFNVRESDLGRPIDDLTHQLDYPTLAADARAAVAGRSRAVEVRARDDRWYSARVSPYRTPEGRNDGAVLSFLDVTDLKRTEEALRQEKEAAERILNTVRPALLIIDGEQRVQSANESFYRLFRLRPGEVIGRPVTEIGERIWSDETLAHRIAEMVSSGEEVVDFDATAEIDGLGERVMLLNGRKLRGDESFLLAFDDFTDTRRAEALNATKEELERRVRAATRRIRQLSSQVTMAELEERNRIAQILHDQLQQILHAIQIKIGLIEEQERSEELVAMLGEIDEWLERALRITRELAVDLSPPVLEKEGLGAAVRWLAGQMASLHGLKVTVEDRQSPDRVFPRDQRTLLFQVVRELLFNVVKHADTDAATVQLSNDDGRFRIEVTDQGKGFEPRSTGSDGFGLDNLRHRLSLFDGELEIRSAPGRGTTAMIRLPDTRRVAS